MDTLSKTHEELLGQALGEVLVAVGMVENVDLTAGDEL